MQQLLIQGWCLKKFFRRETAFSIEELEKILNRILPPSARTHRPWWGNDYSGGTHSHARVWIDAGWKVDPADLKDKWVRFVRE